MDYLKNIGAWWTGSRSVTGSIMQSTYDEAQTENTPTTLIISDFEKHDFQLKNLLGEADVKNYESIRQRAFSSELQERSSVKSEERQKLKEVAIKIACIGAWMDMQELSGGKPVNKEQYERVALQLVEIAGHILDENLNRRDLTHTEGGTIFEEKLLEQVKRKGYLILGKEIYENCAQGKQKLEQLTQQEESKLYDYIEYRLREMVTQQGYDFESNNVTVIMKLSSELMPLTQEKLAKLDQYIIEAIQGVSWKFSQTLEYQRGRRICDRSDFSQLTDKEKQDLDSFIYGQLIEYVLVKMEDICEEEFIEYKVELEGELYDFDKKCYKPEQMKRLSKIIENVECVVSGRIGRKRVEETFDRKVANQGLDEKTKRRLLQIVDTRVRHFDGNYDNEKLKQLDAIIEEELRKQQLKPKEQDPIEQKIKEGLVREGGDLSEVTRIRLLQDIKEQIQKDDQKLATLDDIIANAVKGKRKQIQQEKEKKLP